MLQKNWMELIKPSKMDVNVLENDGKKGVLIAEPLERGFGLTLGNALRRILLSSLQGAAITSVKIKGVVHEFTTIPGVKEDLTDIFLNLKAIAVKVHSPGLKKITFFHLINSNTFEVFLLIHIKLVCVITSTNEYLPIKSFKLIALFSE